MEAPGIAGRRLVMYGRDGALLRRSKLRLGWHSAAGPSEIPETPPGETTAGAATRFCNLAKPSGQDWINPVRLFWRGFLRPWLSNGCPAWFPPSREPR